MCPGRLHPPSDGPPRLRPPHLDNVPRVRAGAGAGVELDSKRLPRPHRTGIVALAEKYAGLRTPDDWAPDFERKSQVHAQLPV